MRRLPVYLLIDSSGSMQGEPIQAVNVGIRAMISALKDDASARQSVHLSLITFDVEIKELLPLTPLEQAIIDDIQLPRSGATHMGEGLDFVAERARINKLDDDLGAMLFIMTDGSPSDLQCFREAIPKIQSIGFSDIIACAAGPKGNTEQLQKITSKVAVLENMDSNGFMQFFRWVGDSISAESRQTASGTSTEQNDDGLPPPPAEIQIVI